jgi:two-component system response regulator FlrC
MKYGNGSSEYRFSPDATAKLLAYEWPGNVRELENVVQRAIVLTDNDFIEAGCLFFDEIIESYEEPRPPTQLGNMNVGRDVLRDSANNYDLQGQPAESVGRNLQTAMESNEFRVIAETLRTCRTRKEASEVLGISERTLRYKMARMKQRGMEIPKRRSA